MTRLVDLSMPVHADMLTFPRVPAPSLLLYESWTDFAERIGAAQYGATSLTVMSLAMARSAWIRLTRRSEPLAYA